MRVSAPWLRGWRRDWGTALAIIACLGLGIGPNVAAFSVIRATLSRSIPVPSSGELYQLRAGSARRSQRLFSVSALAAIRRSIGPRARLGAFTPPVVMFTRPAGSAPLPVTVQLVSGGYFPALDLRPWRGRLLDPADDRASVAVESYRYWARHRYGAPLGRSITIGGVSLTVVGVAPPGFYGLSQAHPAELWIPLRLQARLGYHGNNLMDSNRGPAEAGLAWATQPGIRWLEAVARVPSGASLGMLGALATAADQRALAPYIGQAQPRARAGLRREQVWLSPASTGLGYLKRRLGGPLTILQGLALLVFLVACGDAIILLLIHGFGQRREASLRLALGATRRSLLVDSLVGDAALAVAGGAVALPLALWSRRIILHSFHIHLSPGGAFVAPALILAVGGSIAAALACGIFTASLGVGRTASLPVYARAPTDPRTSRAYSCLTLAQLALAFASLFSAALLNSAWRRVLAVPLGFSPGPVLAVPISPHAAGFTGPSLPALEHTLLAHLAALPGVSAAALAHCGVLLGCRSVSQVAIPAAGKQPSRTVQTQEDAVSPAFFEVLSVAILRGRAFSPADGPGSPPVALASAAFQRTYLRGSRAIGAIVQGPNGPVTIVGLVADDRANGPTRAAPPMLYFPLSQLRSSPHFLAVRAAPGVAAASLTPEVRAALHAISPVLAARRPETLTRRLTGTLAAERASAELAAIFAMLTLAIAAIGLYSTLTFRVARARHPIAVRLAIGARPSQILAQVLSDAARLLVAGLALGAFLSAGAAVLLRSALFGMPPFDPMSAAAASGALVAAAFLASALPAVRAAQVRPWEALREN